MKIDVDEFKKHIEYFKAVNRADIRELEIFLDGQQITPSEEFIDEWLFIGLNNRDFILALLEELGIK